jgi:hypothetical protein
MDLVNTVDAKENVPKNAPEIVTNVFNRKTVETLQQVKIVDTDEATGLELFCYISCSSSDPNIVKECRGVVFNEDKIVMKAFPYTEEYDFENRNDLYNTIGNDFQSCSIFDSHEGALVRLFNYNGKWFNCTHRKLNSFKSRWSSRESFGTSFKRALEEEVKSNAKLSNIIQTQGDTLLDRFYSILDPEKQYMFLIRNNFDNRIVCDPPETPTLYHVGTFINGELSLDDDCYVTRPTKLNFLNLEEVFDYVDNINYKHTQGVIIFSKDNKQYKILNDTYMEFFKVRGNEASVKFRYLQVRMDPKRSTMLKELYPDKVEIFNKYENILYDIVKSIYTAYVNRFIKKMFVIQPKEEFNIMKECHTWHEQNRKENKVNIEKVFEVLNKQNPTYLNKMIRRVIIEKVIPVEQV